MLRTPTGDAVTAVKDELGGVVGTLAVDAMTTRLIPALRESGIEPVLLKGRSFAAWLYAGDGRVYGDCDMLVPPGLRDRAEEVLRARQFEPAPIPPGTYHAQEWIRPAGGSVDLHATIWGATDPASSWAVLSEHTERMRLGPLEITVLDEPARCVHVVLHWVQHMTLNSKPRADLDRALIVADDDTWAEADELAHQLGAAVAFEHGLLAHPVGKELLGRLGIAPSALPDRALSLYLTGNISGASTIEWILSRPTARARAEAIGYKLLPPTDYLRLYFPYRGESQADVHVVTLYFRYWARQAGKIPGGVRQWLLAWRSLSRRRGSG